MDTRINYDVAADIFEAAARADKPRLYLGMSQAGNPCDRFLWFKFRQFTPIRPEARMIFLFRFGDKIEELVCSHLRAAGYKLEHAWPDPQLGFSQVGGILSGHSDGFIHLPEGKALLECKSAKAKKFQAFKLGGVKATNLIYWRQAQLYMGCAGVRFALFVIVNKDDSNIYTELVRFDQVEFDFLINRVRSVCSSPCLPDPIDSTECIYCDFRLHCKTREGTQLHHNCMTCASMGVEIPLEGTPALFDCENPAHPCRIYHPELICREYSWIGSVPF